MPTEATVHIPPGPDRLRVVGPAERNLKMLREALGVHITARGGEVRLSGDHHAVAVARTVLEELAGGSGTPAGSGGTRGADRDGGSADSGPTGQTGRARLHDGSNIPGRRQVLDLIAARAAALGSEADADATARSATDHWDGRLEVHAGGLPIRPKTDNQRAYLAAIRDRDLVFAVGPAGTGKTYLAVAAALHLLRTGRVQKICLVRPAVEAGEKLGFLPGDLAEKVNPYLRPLLDALHDMMDYPTAQKLLASGVVEIAPLAFMRGRTLNGAVIILDEAQNTTQAQMKMFLTRMGHGSKVIVTGDSTQIDLPDPTDSGLIDAARRLRRVRGVGFVSLTGRDVVRHALVQRVIEAYGADHEDSSYRRAVADVFHQPSPTELRAHEDAPTEDTDE